MNFFRQGRWITTGALLIAALCTPLLAAGRPFDAAADQTAATQATYVANVTAQPPRDALVARTHSATLSPHQNLRRLDHFTAALASPVAAKLLTGRPPHIAGLPAARLRTCLSPAASRAPPSLVR